MNTTIGRSSTRRTCERLNRKEVLQSYLMIACSVIGLIVFVIIPLVWVMRYCMYSYKGFGDTVFVGMKNFIRVFTNSPKFWLAVKNTFIFTFGKLLVEIPLALVLAFLLTSKLRGVSFFRTIYFLPSMFSVAVIGVIFSFLFSSYNGVVNELVKLLGHTSIKWFSDGTLAMIVLMIASIWQNFGLNMLFFMTGLQSIPLELYEAAAIDGASTKQQFFNITIPMLGPILQMVLMNAILGSLKVTDLVLVLTDGKPNGQTEVMMTYIYKQFFSLSSSSDYGYGAALVVVTAVILCIVTLIYLRMTKKSGELY